MDEDIIAIIATFLVVFVPVAGVTARIALKPLIDAYAKMLTMRQGNEATQLLERRMALLEQEMQATRSEVQQLHEERDFYKNLAAPAETKQIGS